jgi:hypothetical protein
MDEGMGDCAEDVWDDALGVSTADVRCRAVQREFNGGRCAWPRLGVGI